ncbi:hypothetical protein EV715DRAFT_289372 [Schizophyllum commune]
MATTSSECRPFPIHDLPNEIVDNILTLSIPKELTDPTPGSAKIFRAFLKRTGVRNYPRLLNQVCRKWRTLVNWNATIWSYIFVCAVKNDGYGCEYFPEHYKESLALSKGKTLSLVCILGEMSTSEVLSSPPFAHHVSRMRMLCVDVLGFHNTDQLFPLFEKVATPALEVLRVYDTDDVGASWEYDGDWKGMLHSAPRLSELSFAGFRHDLSIFSLSRVGHKAGIDWSRLTVLRLPDIPCRASDLLFIVSTSIQLQVFQCTVFGHPENDELCPAELSEPLSDSEDDWSEEEDEATHTEEDRQDAAARRATRDQRRAAQQAMMGPHLLPNLGDLHVAVAHHPIHDPNDSWRRRGSDSTVDEYSGMVKFLNGLSTSALSTLAISATNGLASNTQDSDIEDYEDALDSQEHGTGVALLEPVLDDLIRRLQCSVHHLSLSRLFVSLPELLGIIELFPHLHSLHLDRPLRFMRDSLLNGLEERNGHLLAPELRRLVIESRAQNMLSGIKTSEILRMIDSRWPPGWSDTDVAYVKVVHCPSGESEEGTPKNVVQERMCSRIAEMQARKDLELGITELKRDESISNALEIFRIAC